MSDITPPFEHSFPPFVIPDSLDGIELQITQDEHLVFNGLGQEIQRLEAMSDPRFQCFSFFNGYGQDRVKQWATFSRMRFGEAIGHHVIVNEEIIDTSSGNLGGQVNIWDFLLDVSRFHIKVQRSHDTWEGRTWKVRDDSGPHLFYKTSGRLQEISGKGYLQPALGEPRPELSERLRRTMIGTELATFLKGLGVSTREDNVSF